MLYLKVRHKMGKTITPKYIVKLETPGWNTTASEWRVKGGPNSVGYGKPTDANLAEYVRKFSESMLPGGCNEHLQAQSKPYFVTSAAIFLNDGMNTVPLAKWELSDSEAIDRICKLSGCLNHVQVKDGHILVNGK